MGDPKSTSSKGFTPGWNDPPLFSYDSQVSHSSAPRKGNVLTKRVAFPLQSSDTSVNKPIIDPTLPPVINSNLPPPPCSSKIPPPPINHNAPEGECTMNSRTSSISKEEILSKVFSNTTIVINEMSKSETFKDQIDDIQKKLEVLKKMWTEEKLSSIVHQRLLELSDALISKDIKTADHLQVGLMVDFAASCSPWISAFRLMIRFYSGDHQST